MKKDYENMNDIEFIKETLKERGEKLSYNSKLRNKIDDVSSRLHTMKQNQDTLTTIEALRKLPRSVNFCFCELGSSQTDMVISAISEAIEKIIKTL